MSWAAAALLAGAPEPELVAFVDVPLLLLVVLPLPLGLALAVGLGDSAGVVAGGDETATGGVLGADPVPFEQVGFGVACGWLCEAVLLDVVACDGLAEPTGALPLV